MATKRACPNCGSTNKGRSVYRCKNCGFVGCLSAGVFSSSGCWKGSECPRCDKRDTHHKIAIIGEVDSN
jgi:hypothetical protein